MNKALHPKWDGVLYYDHRIFIVKITILRM